MDMAMSKNTNDDGKPQDAPESNNERDVVFLDMFKPSQPRAASDKVAERLEICRSCEFFNNRLQQCTKCGCFMKLKTKLDRAHCPIGHW